jgi:peptide/nickel transport system permease protein
MFALIGRKLLYLFPVILAVTALTFLISNLLPGDLAIAMLGDQATPEAVAALHQKLGLDLPLWQRYFQWLGAVLEGDFGFSIRTGETVLHAIAGRLPVSLELLVIAELGGLLIGVPLAILCAVRPGSGFDRAVCGIAFGILSVPPFMLAILLIFIFALRLGVLPATAYVPLWQDVLGNLRAMVLPGATLALLEWPTIMRVLRSDMISTLQEDYIAMARAKGLTSRRILLVHALKPSSLTLVTVIGLNIGRLIGGAVVTESIFALPGVGRLLVESIYLRDFIILQGGVLLVAIGFVLVNFFVDLLYAALDPRIRHGRA